MKIRIFSMNLIFLSTLFKATALCTILNEWLKNNILKWTYKMTTLRRTTRSACWVVVERLSVFRVGQNSKVDILFVSWNYKKKHFNGRKAIGIAFFRNSFYTWKWVGTCIAYQVVNIINGAPSLAKRHKIRSRCALYLFPRFSAAFRVMQTVLANGNHRRRLGKA